MDQSWTKVPHISDNYHKGVEDFLQFTQQNAPVLAGKYLCPCVNCVNERCQSLNDIRSHVICDGFSPSYTNWIWHGELPHMLTTLDTDAVDVQMGDRMEEMIRDLGQESFRLQLSVIQSREKSASTLADSEGTVPSPST